VGKKGRVENVKKEREKEKYLWEGEKKGGKSHLSLDEEIKRLFPLKDYPRKDAFAGP